ncbi:MAG: DNA primase [Candidatus Symbiothrix sp.]|jgi:DNA primase|nr:DNA primase [Candidatus Symbiothrix sp.]
MIDNQTVERIQGAAQIYDVVSDFVSLRKRGVNWVGLCPFHEDSSPSFYVSPAKNICKCFACGEGGTPIHFIMKHEQMSYPEALKYLAKKYNIEVRETELTEEQKQAHNDREALFIINGFAQKTFSNQLFISEEGQNIGLSYFRERGFREDIIKKFLLGYALEERDAFTQTALKAGYKQSLLEKVGLTIVGEHNYVADRFRGRVMFPVQSLSGKIVAFGGRVLQKEAKTAKYVNSPESEIYHKSNELYGIYLARQAIVKQDKCFLVEGYTDVISMHQTGIENVVASSGTALTIGQIQLIRRFTNNVTVLYDGDSAGIKAAVRGIDLLLEAGLNIKIVLLPEGEDPDSFSKKQSATAFHDYIQAHEEDFVQFKTGLLLQDAGNDPVKKAHIINEIVATIALIPEEIIRLVYVKECSRLLDMDERVLVRAIAAKRNELLLRKKPTTHPNENTNNTPVGATRAVAQNTDTQNTNTPTGAQQNATSDDTQPGQPQGSAPTISPLDPYERNLMYYVIRYGEKNMTYVDDETQETLSVNVIESIVQDLQTDELELVNPLYKKILDEAFAHYQDENFVSESYFQNHPNPYISHFAVDVSTNKYIESKVHSKYKKVVTEEEKLLELVLYAVLNYKDAILKQQMDDINRRMAEAQTRQDADEQQQLVIQLAELWRKSKKELALHLRERIITKI